MENWPCNSRSLLRDRNVWRFSGRLVRKAWIVSLLLPCFYLLLSRASVEKVGRHIRKFVQHLRDIIYHLRSWALTERYWKALELDKQNAEYHELLFFLNSKRAVTIPNWPMSKYFQVEQPSCSSVFPHANPGVYPCGGRDAQSYRNLWNFPTQCGIQ